MSDTKPTSVRVPMCMSDNMVYYPIEIQRPVTLHTIKEAAGKKFKDYKPKKGRSYHNVTGQELTEEVVASLFSGVGGACIVLSMKEWKGAAKLRESFAASSASLVCAHAFDTEDSPLENGPDPLSADPALSSTLRRAASLLCSADALLVLVGAGMGVDSGLDTFRSKDGSYTKEEYITLARHAFFKENPIKAWQWHGTMLETFRATIPHDGYTTLLKICGDIGNFFVCTSNIDGAFLKAGFPSGRLFEAHGSAHRWQCMDPKCNRSYEPWPASCLTGEALPQCNHCDSIARPNVAFFDDNIGSNARTFNPRYIEPQKARFTSWFHNLVARRVVLLEIGCGVNEHSLRVSRKADGAWACMSGEWKIPALMCPLVRIDPSEESDGGADFVHIQLGSKDACTQIAACMQADL